RGGENGVFARRQVARFRRTLVAVRPILLVPDAAKLARRRPQTGLLSVAQVPERGTPGRPRMTQSLSGACKRFRGQTCSRSCDETVHLDCAGGGGDGPPQWGDPPPPPPP